MGSGNLFWSLLKLASRVRIILNRSHRAMSFPKPLPGRYLSEFSDFSETSFKGNLSLLRNSTANKDSRSIIKLQSDHLQDRVCS